MKEYGQVMLIENNPQEEVLIPLELTVTIM